jgi:ABC-type sulfate transport system permease subunit
VVLRQDPGQTNTMPLQVEILYNEVRFTAAFAVASLLALLALVTLALKTLLEWRFGDEIAATNGPLNLKWKFALPHVRKEFERYPAL